MRILQVMRTVWVLVCFFDLSGAVIDLTMISTAEATHINHFYISCINGERSSARVELNIKRDNKILQLAREPSFTVNKPTSKEVVARDFRHPENIGIFYCETTQEVPLQKVTMINNIGTANFVPHYLTLTVNKGETAHLTMKLLSPEKRDVTWKYNGNYYYMTHWNEVVNRTATLVVENATLANQGVFSASYFGDSPLNGAWMRLIVRDCPRMKWGPACDRDCPVCLNAGVCHGVNGDCVCPPGFMGTRCEMACREGMFGRNCQESCGPLPNGNCKGLRFCLPDPYGCSCASGWFGRHCEKACYNNMYGPDCRLSCKCQNGGVCNRFSGCQCLIGWRGQNCEKSDRAPQILDLDSNLEWNLNSSPKIKCSATGNPLPSHNSIELRKLDSTILKASQTIMEANKSTALFEIPRLNAQQGGLWECRVSTNGGQDSRKFNLTVKEPPVPTTAPKLLEKRSKQLVVMPAESHRGDGPVISTRLLYKPVENGNSWSSIIVYSDKEPITLMNLEPSTRYLVRVQLTRPGEGGEGSPGPEAIMETDCPGLRNLTPTTQGVVGRPIGDSYQLVVAVVASVTVTCVTIMLALLALFFIRKMLLNRRRTFTYQSGSGEETILQFNSGTLTLTRRPKPTPEPLTYPILEWEDIKFEDVIGEGNFGQVIKAMIKKDGNKMSAAIKMLKEFASENDHRDFAGELEVLCKLGQHPNIINLIGACENRGYLYIAIEYAPYGNLLDFLRKSRVLETDPAFAKEHGTASTLTSQQLLQFAVDVATGMHYLSDKQFIHRDLAARNVLVGDNLVAKIADFGLSRGEEVYVKKTMGRLPVRWMAIESLNYSVYTSKSDVWSFGVLLWEIVSLGGTPYCGMTCAELYEKLPQGYRMEKPKNCDDEVYELMKQCWRDRPYERPPFSQISVQVSRMQEARKAYVNMALFENFTYAGIDATAEEA
ncbi:tyrosine-protein kinase receptor Tie-1 isoform X2 [Nothobranchius furzeri]|uniref:Tyrosine-protein kinase receptor Tie-1 n=1 Tax=Nothobranchius furzeri TaxID=105023 RepID=A0A1A7ZWB5_NOTFU